VKRTLRTLVIVGCTLGVAGVAFAQTVDQHRFILTANAGIHSLAASRTDTVTFDLHAETGTLETTQSIGPDPMFDGGAAVRVSRQAAVGVAVSYAQGQTDATIDALIPHPFFFDFHRQAQGTASDLAHRELGIHLQGQFWIPLSPSILLTLSGGPTYFNAARDLVMEITPVEVGFPFDEVDIASHTTTRISKNALGYNVGVDLAYFLSDRIGLGFTTRYSRATSDVDLEGAPPLKLGGLHTVAGVRVGF
jgi:hypothetical protein